MDKKMMEKMMKGKESEKKDSKKEHKLNVLKDISNEMKEMMGKDLGSLKKVTVAGEDDESLMAGLDKAKSLLKDMDEDEE